MTLSTLHRLQVKHANCDRFQVKFGLDRLQVKTPITGKNDTD